MKHLFKFVNISGGAFHDVTNDVLAMEYKVNTALAA